MSSFLYANGPSGPTLSLDVSTVISGENTNPPQPRHGSESFRAAPSTSARPALVTPSDNLGRQVFRRPDLGGGDPRGCGKGGSAVQEGTAGRCASAGEAAPTPVDTCSLQTLRRDLEKGNAYIKPFRKVS